MLNQHRCASISGGFPDFRRTYPDHHLISFSSLYAGSSRHRRIRLRIMANNRFVIATSAIWNVTYRLPLTTFAPILTNFSRRVVNDQCLISSGNANVRMKLARL